MKISYNWLKQFINLDWEPEKTSELLTNLGLEVEGLEKYSSIKGGLEGIIVGHIEKCEKHPNADRLKVTSVNVGKETLLKIVCGAPNVKKGQKVAVATIGTTLYNSDGESWKIKKGKIRGEESNGMLCAEDEIGLGESHDGILILDDKFIPLSLKGAPTARLMPSPLRYTDWPDLSPEDSPSISAPRCTQALPFQL